MFPPLVSTVHVCNANGTISFKFRCLHSICCYINGWNSRLCYYSKGPPNHLGSVFFDVLETLQVWEWTLVTSSFTSVNKYQKQQSLQKILNSCHCFCWFFPSHSNLASIFLKLLSSPLSTHVFPTPRGEGALRVARFSSGRNPTKFQNHLGNSTNREAAYGHGWYGPRWLKIQQKTSWEHFKA